ncbi:MAG: hypothetical protein Q4G51_13020 [Dermatophilus congolensis]|nr:hypothetical protein [Dermatophilus congolensis]
MELFDLEAIDEYSPFEFDTQAPHLFKHPGASMDTVLEVWHADPVFYKAQPPAHWLMLAELDGQVWLVPLAPSRSGDPHKCRPIGCYIASTFLADMYRRDR